MQRSLFLLVMGFMLAAHGGIAQDSTKALRKNAVMFEGGGNGIIASLSYERIFYHKNNLRLCARAGIGILPHIGERDFHLEDHLFPFVEATVLHGKRKGYVETGFGYTYQMEEQGYTVYTEAGGFKNYKYHNHLFLFRLGYRYQSTNGFLMRIAATQIMYFERDEWNTPEGDEGEYRIYPWVGLSLGFSF